MSTKADNANHEFPGQLENEQVKLVFRQHPLVMRKELIVGLLLINLGVLPLVFPQVYDMPALADVLVKIAFGLPLLVLVWWFYHWVGWYYTLFIVTDARLVIIKQKGFFDRAVQEWQLNKIYNINYHVNGLQAAMFGYGNIICKTAIGEFTMETVHKPVEIHKQLLLAVRDAGGAQGAPFDNSPGLM